VCGPVLDEVVVVDVEVEVECLEGAKVLDPLGGGVEGPKLAVDVSKKHAVILSNHHF